MTKDKPLSQLLQSEYKDGKHIKAKNKKSVPKNDNNVFSPI